MKLGLYQKELLAVDGSKFRAVNSKDNTYNVEILEKPPSNALKFLCKNAKKPCCARLFRHIVAER
jgi:hypothetical protein